MLQRERKNWQTLRNSGDRTQVWAGYTTDTSGTSSVSRPAGHIEFLTANTATPVPSRYGLPFDLVKKVIAYFQETGSRSPEVAWEQI